MLKKHRIYLDTKYWIHMRDASTGVASPVHIEIYNKLKLLSQGNVVICPLSPHLFEELMKIGNEHKRHQTAKVMDELSQHITLISPLKIPRQELLCFIQNCQNKAAGKTISNPAKYVWTKVSFILGELHPYNENLCEAQNEHIQVEFFKYRSELTLIQMLDYVKEFPALDKSPLIRSLNEGKDQNLDFKTFHDVFMQEVAGVLDMLINDIREIWKYLYLEETGQEPTSAEIVKSESVENMQRIIYNAFKLNKIDKELPFIHVQAAINAFVRYNKQQRFKVNDLNDISHAAWGLPYCHAFFTERRLASWICNAPLNLQQIYGTSVYHQEEDILAYLNRIQMN